MLKSKLTITSCMLLIESAPNFRRSGTKFGLIFSSYFSSRRRDNLPIDQLASDLLVKKQLFSKEKGKRFNFSGVKFNSSDAKKTCYLQLVF